MREKPELCQELRQRQLTRVHDASSNVGVPCHWRDEGLNSLLERERGVDGSGSFTSVSAPCLKLPKKKPMARQRGPRYPFAVAARKLPSSLRPDSARTQPGVRRDGFTETLLSVFETIKPQSNVNIWACAQSFNQLDEYMEVCQNEKQ